MWEFLLNFRNKISFFPWDRYSKEYLRKKNVSFTDDVNTRFLGPCHLFISSASKMSIGHDFVCRSGPKFSFDNISSSKIVVNEGASLTIGNNVGMSNTLIHCNSEITIGNYVKIGGGCMIFDSNFHSLDWMKRRNPTLDREDARKAGIVIEDDAFIGARSTICKGVTVGARSIVQAGSVVVKSIPTDCIAGGNPCEVIKYINKEQ